MHPLREQLFVILNRGADSASRFFNLPNDRIFEVGSPGRDLTFTAAVSAGDGLRGVRRGPSRPPGTVRGGWS